MAYKNYFWCQEDGGLYWMLKCSRKKFNRVYFLFPLLGPWHLPIFCPDNYEWKPVPAQHAQLSKWFNCSGLQNWGIISIILISSIFSVFVAILTVPSVTCWWTWRLRIRLFYSNKKIKNISSWNEWFACCEQW